jgi:hypothetical protein
MEGFNIELISIVKLKQIASSSQYMQKEYLDSINIPGMNQYTLIELQTNLGEVPECSFNDAITILILKKRFMLVTIKKLKEVALSSKEEQD